MLSPFAPGFAFEIAEWCDEHGVVVTAHTPMAGAFQRDQADKVGTLSRIAEKHSLTQAQVMLTWLVERGNTAVIPGSGNPAHMRSNLGIYSASDSASLSASLSAEDIAEVCSRGELEHAPRRRVVHIHGHAREPRGRSGEGRRALTAMQA